MGSRTPNETADRLNEYVCMECGAHAYHELSFVRVNHLPMCRTWLAIQALYPELVKGLREARMLDYQRIAQSRKGKKVNA